MNAATVTTAGRIMLSASWWPEPMRRLGLALLGLLAMAQAQADDARLALGRQVFTEQAQPTCSLCHSLREAGASVELCGVVVDRAQGGSEALAKAGVRLQALVRASDLLADREAVA